MEYQDEILCELIAKKAFILRKDRLYVSKELIRIVSPNMTANSKKKYIEASLFSKEFYDQLFDFGDESKIRQIIKSGGREPLSINYTSTKVDYLIKKQIQKYYHWLPFYLRCFGASNIESAKIHAIQHALILGFVESELLLNNTKEFMEKLDALDLQCKDVLSLINKVNNNPGTLSSFHYDDKISQYLVPGYQLNRLCEIPKPTNDLIKYLFLNRSARSSNGSTEYQQLLINFIFDNQCIDEEKIISIDANEISEITWRYENDRIGERGLIKFRARIEEEIGAKIYIPLEHLVFVVYRFDFVQERRQNAIPQSKRLLVIYDFSTKFILYNNYLTGDILEIRRAIKRLLEEYQISPRVISFDTALHKQASECREILSTFKSETVDQSCENFRFSHYLDYYSSKDHQFAVYRILRAKERLQDRSYVIEMPLWAEFEESVNDFPDYIVRQFNNFDGLSYVGNGGSPQACFKLLKKYRSQKVTPSKIAKFNYEETDCVAKDNICLVRVCNYVYRYTLKRKIKSGGFSFLINLDNIEGTDGFLISGTSQITARYLDKFVFDENFSIDGFNTETLNARLEVSKLLRNELMIPERTKLDNIFDTNQSRTLRREHNKIKYDLQG